MLFIPLSYDRRYLQYDRIHPAFSKKISALIQDIIENKFNSNFIDRSYPMVDEKYKIDLLQSFKHKVIEKFQSSRLNSIIGLDNFNQVDICLGCTHYIDNLYLYYGKDDIQVLEGEYPYHLRLYPDMIPSNPNNLSNKNNLIISFPFVNGNKHSYMDNILDVCLQKNINVHLDCAWLSAARNINFDFNHPAIKTVGLSLSKGYGLGWNRVGIRLSRSPINDNIKIINDFQMIPNIIVSVAHYFLDNIEVDHLWIEHERRYEKICNDFNLMPTSSIHVALDNGKNVGICDLLRYLEYNQ